jgi:membrane protein
MIVSHLKLGFDALHRFPWRVALTGLRQRFRDDRLGQTAGALTFTTTIALVPLLTVALAVLTAFPLFGQFQTVLQRWLVESLIPDSIARQVLGYLTQFTSKASRLGFLGFVALLFSAVALVFTIDRTLNAIWRVRQARPWGQRVLIYWAALTLGPLVLATSLFMLTTALTWGGQSWGPGQAWLRFILDVLEFGLTALGIGALYKYVPHTHVPARHAWWGGTLAAIVLEVARWALAQYLAKVGTFAAVYGAFATVPILLVWIYTTWVIVLVGAVAVASLPSWLSGAVRDNSAPGWLFQLALEVVRQLIQQRGTAPHGMAVLDLASELQADTRDVEAVLTTMVDADWVGRLVPSDEAQALRYVWLADPSQLPLAPLMSRYLLADVPANQALWARWQGLRLADAL